MHTGSKSAKNAEPRTEGYRENSEASPHEAPLRHHSGIRDTYDIDTDEACNVTMTACEDLPRELIAAIADNLDNDKKSLQAFSLVCKAWTNLARHHLFASLCIYNLEGLAKIKAANITSTYTPFLRHLHLIATVDYHKFWQDIIPFLAAFETPRLWSLEVYKLMWHSLSPAERSALLRRFESIGSLELNLYGQNTSNDVVTIICSFPHLRQLILESHELARPGPSQAPLSPGFRLPERLSTLRVSSFDDSHQSVLKWLRSFPEQLSIRIFQTTVFGYEHPPPDVDNINKFLKVLGPSLEVFVCETDEEYVSLDLTCNTHLRCIDFHFCGEGHSSGDVLSAMSTLSQIRSRHLELVVFHIPCWKDGEFPVSQWIQLDAMLAGPPFTTLKDIRMSVISFSPAVTDLPTLFATSLPKCHARGIVSLVDPEWWGL